ncbi:MAG: GxxExxY protein [Prevotellaceae bacterium]|jgi:GxxExxY protein|nr:GxxExxY protein [Prevotellaceae bacterium]
MKHEVITSQIIRAAYNVHNELGSGFLEKVYHNAMIVELQEMGFTVCSEKPIPVLYKNKLVGDYYADLLVNDLVVVEFKAVETLNPIHEVQLVNYLVGTGIDVGLLINFGHSVVVKRKYREYKKQ